MKKLLIVSLVMLFGMGMMAGNARADNYDPTGAPGAPPLVQLGGTLWNHGGIGDALYGQMYRAVIGDTVSDPFRFVTYISIENVSNNFVAAHVRLRSGRYSIEVRDFPILLSPRDVFWFQFEVVPDLSGGIESVRIFSHDAETLASSGLSTTGEWVVNLDAALLNQFDTLYPEGAPLEELTQGYIEVFGLFECTSNQGLTLPNIMTQLWSTRNVAGLAAFTADSPRWQYPMDVKKSLAGHVFLGDFTNGLYMGYPMHAIKDFRTNDTTVSFPAPGRNQPIHRDIDAQKATSTGAIIALRTLPLAAPATARLPNVPGDLGGQNAVGAWYEAGCILYSFGGNDLAYSDPDWATSFGPTWNDGDDLTGLGIWPHDSWSLDEVDDALVKQRVQSTYFNGGFSDQTFTLLSLTFPTKYLHLFYDAPSGLVDADTLMPLGDTADGAFGSRRFGWPVGHQPGGQRTIRAQMDIEKYTGVVNARASAWDLAENRPGDFSPYTWLTLPYEVNFLPIGDLSIPALEPFCFLSVPQPDSPFGLLRYADGYYAGQLFLEGFSLSGALLQGDPRTLLFNVFGVGGYARVALPLLRTLEAAPYFDAYIIPVLGITMDWEFTGFSHARSIDVNFDNMVLGGPPLNDYPVF